MDRDGNEHQVRRINFPRPAGKKQGRRHLAMQLELGKQEPGHQEAAQDEEEINANPPTLLPGGQGHSPAARQRIRRWQQMTAEHQHNGHETEQVKARLTRRGGDRGFFR